MKERIQSKAKELFHQYGFKSVTMDEIASQSGVSKKTIYQYYSDKDELVDVVIRNITSYSKFLCDQNIGMARDAVHELFQAMNVIQQIIGDMNPVMMYDLERAHPNSYKVFLDFRNKYLHDVIIANLHRGIKEGLYRPDINIELVTKIRLEQLMLGFNQHIFPPSKFNIVDTQKSIIEHFLFGVASLKGFNLILKYKEESTKS